MVVDEGIKLNHGDVLQFGKCEVDYLFHDKMSRFDNKNYSNLRNMYASYNAPGFKEALQTTKSLRQSAHLQIERT